MSNPLIGKDEADQIVEQSVIYCNDCGGFRIASRQCGRPCGSNPHAVALGRLGGAAGKGATSERKSASSRANMQKAAQASAAKKRAAKLYDATLNGKPAKVTIPED